MIDRNVAPDIHPFKHLTLPEPEERRLAGDTPFSCLNLGSLPVCRVILSWLGGTYEVPSPNALALMTELLREGTRERTGKEVSELLDFNGAWFKADAGIHNVGISMHLLSRTAADVIPLLGEIASSPSFPEETFLTIREKMAAKSELDRRQVLWQAKLADRRLVYGDDHPGAQEPTPDVVRAITRDEVVEYWRRTLGASVPAIYAAGDTEPVVGSLETLAREVLPRTDAAAPFALRIKPIESAPDGTVSRVEVPGALQSAVIMSLPVNITRANPDYAALRLVLMALGGYFGSRLMQNIREERGLTYGISSYLVGTHEGVYATIISQTDPRNVDELIAEVHREIERLATEPPTGAELDAVRRGAMSSLASTLDSPFTVMDMRILRDRIGLPLNYFDLQQQAALTLTTDRIADLTRRYLLPAPRLTSIAGPEA